MTGSARSKPTDQPDAYCTDCPFADRGDWVMYRQEYEALTADAELGRKRGEWLTEAYARISELEVENRRLREALERIERLQDRWSAPLRHPVGDMRDPAYAGAAAWAAVGSEAHKIAKDALRA